MKKIKAIIDVIMSISILFLMAFQVTGDQYHEWIGAGMLILFLIHNLLNIGWYKVLFKGKYSALRIFRTVVNLLVLAAIFVTGYSGIVMSRYVFDFLSIHGGMATARRLHLAGSYWAFVLMSIHMGMHWSMMTIKYMNGKWRKPILLWGIRGFAGILAIAGAYFFGKSEIFHNMFLQNEFAILDYETKGFLIILQNLLMLITWIFVGHYSAKGIENLSVYWKKEHSVSTHGVLSIGIAIVMILICLI